MSVENTIRIIKKVHPISVILVKVGNFYHAYNKDAYILSYLFDYKVKTATTNKSCGFPVSSLNRVMVELEKQKINYLVVDRKDNYEVNNEEDYKKENKYEEIYSLAVVRLNIKNRIDEIYEYLLNAEYTEILKEKIKKVEEILYEN